MQPVERGVVVQLTDGATRSAVARVSYDRMTSTHPWRSFKGQLRSAIRRAESEANRLNGEGMGTSGEWRP